MIISVFFNVTKKRQIIGVQFGVHRLTGIVVDLREHFEIGFDFCLENGRLTKTKERCRHTQPFRWYSSQGNPEAKKTSYPFTCALRLMADAQKSA
ncbi:hypothetical protein [Flavivirga sp. 57AJ16]|uniref:hypothetical protein n=1 Tax=Flavivirga sp. 57AJ16 TaxID=3025307 RepID=UPI00236664DE|nr:hypothetical protein [Flavivirga sp. 57AJ16]MDD7886959.1 hypothetical protein [Flavivirga sp. 57AJ16]